MITTERVEVKIPRGMVIAARERYPVVRDLSLGKVLRFTLALALGMTRTEAMEVTKDARTIRRYA